MLLPWAKRLLINEIVDNHAVHIRAAATTAVEYTMNQMHIPIPNYLPIPPAHGVVPMTSTATVPRGGMEVPKMATTAPVAAPAVPHQSFIAKAETWLEHAGKVIATDLSKTDVVLKNVIPIAQFTATIFSFTPYGAIAAEVVQLIVLAEGTLAAAGQQTGSGVTKAAIVTNSIGGLIEKTLTDAGADGSATAVQKVIDSIVGFLNKLDPAMFAQLQQALSGNLLAA
jgi:hypothetical protein